MTVSKVWVYKMVKIVLERELIKQIDHLDAAHTKAHYNQKSSKDFLMGKLKLLRKAVYQIDEIKAGATFTI